MGTYWETTMTIDTEGALAGGPLTEDAAADLIMGTFGDDDETVETQSADTPSDTEDADYSDDGEQGEAAAETEATGEDEGEPPAGDDEPTEEPEFYDIEKLNPDMPFRLRDGREFKWGEIKRGLAELQDLPRYREELTAAATKFQTERTQVAQQAQFLGQTLPLAIEVLKSSLPDVPPMPDAQLASTNVLEYNKQLAAHLSGREARAARENQLRQLTEAQQAQSAQAQQADYAQQQDYLRQQHHLLTEKLPDLRDPQKARQFHDEFVQAGQAYGFSPEEMAQARDHRLMLLARDAISWRKLQASKPKAEKKAAGAPPVKAPGKRASEGEQKARVAQEKFAQLRKTGRADVADDLILNLL
jgi:hypothetical protein